ncbi:MAG: TetR/AcrR family transcriptional regulator [Cyclobacteriaceae bacterium]|nr:TetR/AcrR family transcriptional regulator [Cyclobacteriaceae bacterium]
MAVLTFKLNDKLYLRDPQNTQLGQKIISKSVEMIDQLGFEQFTFKKLAEEIESTEASVYRYFENKHRLLHYLVAWYWNWLDYRIELATSSLGDPQEKLKAALWVITQEKKYDPTFEFVNEEALHRIVVSELDKTYLTKWVDEDNSVGLFGGFKTLAKKIASFVKEINPDYPYANSLISSVLLAANQQLFFIDHLPSLSNISKSDPVTKRHEKLREFIQGIVFASIQS